MPAMNEYMPTLVTVEKSTPFVGFILPNRKPNIPIPTRITEIVKIIVINTHHSFLYFSLSIAHFVFLFNIVGLKNGVFGANDKFWGQTTKFNPEINFVRNFYNYYRLEYRYVYDRQGIHNVWNIDHLQHIL